MKVNPNFTLRNIGDIYLIVNLSEDDFSSQKIITTNETGAFLWQCLQKGSTKKELLSAIQNVYEIDYTTALTDIHFFLDELSRIDALYE